MHYCRPTLWLSGVVIAVVDVCRRWPATWLCGGCSGLFVVILPCRFAAASLSPLSARCCVLQRSGLLLLGQNQHGEHDDDGGSDCQRGAVGNVQRGDTHKHAGAVGNEPDEPHANAQAMEIVALLAIAAQQNAGRPGCVEEHERDGEAAGDGVQKRDRTAAALGHGAHDGGAGGVACEADSEENEMRALQRAGIAFAENANRVSDKGEGDYRGGGDKNR